MASSKFNKPEGFDVFVKQSIGKVVPGESYIKTRAPEGHFEERALSPIEAAFLTIGEYAADGEYSFTVEAQDTAVTVTTNFESASESE